MLHKSYAVGLKIIQGSWDMKSKSIDLHGIKVQAQESSTKSVVEKHGDQ